jgi:hypothetical protein
MPRGSYDAATKEAIIHATVEARRAGKTWREAHAAAKASGYQGSQQGIVKLLGGKGMRRRRRGRKPGRPPGVKKLGRRPGRPGRPPGSASPASDIASLVDKLVQSRINGALDQAIAVLRGAKQ